MSGEEIRKVAQLTCNICNHVSPFKMDKVIYAVQRLGTIFPEYKWGYTYDGQDYIISMNIRKGRGSK